MAKSIVALLVLGLVLFAGQLSQINILGLKSIQVPHVDSTVCRDPREHVYHPNRLTLIDPCIQVTGVVKSVRYEEDGDYHILIEVDEEFAALIGEGNRRLQRGWLVVETVCSNIPKTRAATEACGDYINPIEKPVVSTRVVIVGPYVLDTEHSDWAEIHPAWRIIPL